MKKSSTMALLALCALTANAQNYKEHHPQVSHLYFPDKIQNAEINTYSVALNIDENSFRKYGIYKSSLLSLIRMNAFARVEVNGENVVSITLGEPGNIDYGVKSEVYTKDGKQYTNYYYQYSYSLPNSYDVKGTQGQVLTEGKIDGTGAGFTTYKYKSQAYQSSDQCQKYFNSGGGGQNEIRAHVSGKMTEIFKSINEKVQSTIDYVPAGGFERIYTFKSGKKGDFSGYDAAAEKMDEAFKLIKVGEDRSAFAQAAKEPVAFWRSQLPSLDYSNKDQENQYTAVTLNLATTYYWEDKLDSAQYFAELAKQTNDKKSDIASTIRQIKYRGDLMSQLKANHIDLYKGLGNASMAEVSSNTVANLVKKILNDPANFTTSKGQVLDRNGKLMNVEFKQYKVMPEPEVSAYSEKLYYKETGSEAEFLLNNTNVKYYEMDGQKYEYVRFYPCTEVSSYVSDMLKIVYDSPKIRVYEYDTKVTNTIGSPVNILYKRPSEDVATNTSSVKFLFMFKKSLAKYFADCATVKANAEAGSYGKSRESFMKAAEEYASCK